MNSKHLFIRTTIVASLIVLTNTFASAQTILGTWQMIDESNCIESELPGGDDATAALADDMKSLSSPGPQTVQFKEKGAGVESTRILNRKKGANSKNFLYKFNGESLFILDKKSQTLTENYNVDRLSADSLILSSASRPCDIRIFVKIKDPK